MMDTNNAFSVWSPGIEIVAFHPVITPTVATLPLTPFIAKTMPYFTLSPQDELVHEQPTIMYHRPSFFTPAPILQPAPGSKESSTPRKRRRLPYQLGHENDTFSPSVKRMRAMTTPITTDDYPLDNNKPESPSYPEEYALVDEDAVQDPHDAIEVSKLSTAKVASTVHSAVNKPPFCIVETVETAETPTDQRTKPLQVTDRVEPFDESNHSDDNESDSDYSLNKTPRRPRTLKHLKLDSSDNWLDKALIAGGLRSPTLLNRIYSCPECSQTYRFRKHCRRHMIIHIDSKYFTCEDCGTKFSRQDSLKRHHQNRCKNRCKKRQNLM